MKQLKTFQLNSTQAKVRQDRALCYHVSKLIWPETRQSVKQDKMQGTDKKIIST